MHPSHMFDTIYNQLSQAWEAHRALRRSHASISELNKTSLELHRARRAMWDLQTRSSVGIR